MSGVFVVSAALVDGYAARALGLWLARAVQAGDFDVLPPGGREDVLRAVRAIERAGEAWMVARASDSGTSEVVVAEARSLSTHDTISIYEAAGLLSISPRRVRTLAAEGLGRKVGGRWVLGRSEVLAELERRAVA